MTSTKNRVGLIDGMRGWALFGILLANLLIFQYGIMGKDEISYFNLSSTNLITYYGIKLLIENSFMPIFTFLFGYSLILMRNSLKRRQLRIKWHLFRRFIMLIALGLLHSMFLWEGDILFSYGMIGLFLLFFVNRKPKTIFVWTIILLSILTIISFFGADEDVSLTVNTEYIKQTVDIYGTGTYSEIKYHRNNVDPLGLDEEEALAMLVIFPLIMLPMFLIGMYAAHKQWFIEPGQQKHKYKRAMLILIPLGLILKATFYFADDLTWVIDLSMLGDMVLAIGYICLFAFTYTTYFGNRIMIGLENLGRLSLTNYIMQTVICTFIFYGYGLGLFAKMGVILSIIVGGIIFTLQAYTSTIYLNYFKQGPLEKLIRIFTYLNVRKNRTIEQRNNVENYN